MPKKEKTCLVFLLFSLTMAVSTPFLILQIYKNCLPLYCLTMAFSFCLQKGESVLFFCFFPLQWFSLSISISLSLYISFSLSVTSLLDIKKKTTYLFYSYPDVPFLFFFFSLYIHFRDFPTKFRRKLHLSFLFLPRCSLSTLSLLSLSVTFPPDIKRTQHLPSL